MGGENEKKNVENRQMSLFDDAFFSDAINVNVDYGAIRINWPFTMAVPPIRIRLLIKCKTEIPKQQQMYFLKVTTRYMFTLQQNSE